MSSKPSVKSAVSAGSPSRHHIDLVVIVLLLTAGCLAFSPLLTHARRDRQRSVCANNLQQIGLALQQYVRDSGGTLPVAYHYNNAHPNQTTGLDDTGIHHWSSMLRPYMYSYGLFVCPADTLGGQPPTNFNLSTNNEGEGVPPGATSGVAEHQDDQAPRISYTANEQLLPRPRGGVGGVKVGQRQNLVSISMVTRPMDTIAIAEFTDHFNAVSGGGPGGIKFKSHRPSSALAMDRQGTVPYDTSAAVHGPVYAMSPAAAQSLFDRQAAIKFGSSKEPHLAYANAGRHEGGDNLLFLDGHVKWERIAATLGCDNFQWGTRLYNQGGAPVMCPATGLPVK